MSMRNGLLCNHRTRAPRAAEYSEPDNGEFGKFIYGWRRFYAVYMVLHFGQPHPNVYRNIFVLYPTYRCVGVELDRERAVSGS